jgi:alpha-L-fucosidase
VPAWFRDAKFGIWAHWGPQCQPEQGDWYARKMYEEGSEDYRDHVRRYGHPSRAGFKDVIHEWKAERWDPARLLALYKRAGAQYFFALANHHDNFDLWDSKHQPWNAVRMGPKKDLIAGWAKAARDVGLRFGVSVHAAHAWTWYEPAQGADRGGPQAGVPYDGRLTRADGKGEWWDGYDPQDLYAQNHAPSVLGNEPHAFGRFWDWGKGTSLPDAAYAAKLYDRTVDLINRYHPDLIYFDDTGLPLWPVSDVGLRIAAHYYNANMMWHHGLLEGVLFGKVLTEPQRHAVVWDIERGQSDRIEPLPFQTDTCLGDWHYKRSLYEQHKYKSAATVIHMLADVVSKNGNLLLNVPVRGDGTIDADEIAVVEDIARWTAVNGEAIFGTRPWVVAGEGPAMESAAPIQAQGFNEGTGKPFTARDVRFTAKRDATKGDVIYAILLGWPAEETIAIHALGAAARRLDARQKITAVSALGSGENLRWSRTDAALEIARPHRPPSAHAIVLEIRTTPGGG